MACIWSRLSVCLFTQLQHYCPMNVKWSGHGCGKQCLLCLHDQCINSFHIHPGVYVAKNVCCVCTLSVHTHTALAAAWTKSYHGQFGKNRRAWEYVISITSLCHSKYLHIYMIPTLHCNWVTTLITPIPSHTHTHTHTLAQNTRAHTHNHILSLSLSLSHTHTHTHNLSLKPVCMNTQSKGLH